jgi:hypothetical protein
MLTVFYGEQVWDTFDNWSPIRKHALGEEVYNGAYVYNNAPDKYTNVPWSRADGCPCLIEDVPSVLRMMALLLE